MIKHIFYKVILAWSIIAPAAEAMDKLSLSINHHLFYLEVPKSIEEYNQGLMYRHNLPPSHGMIFLFDLKAKSHPTMWMKNTYLSLDMLFIDPDYKIACILEYTKPLSLDLLSCDTQVAAVIELNAGDVKRYQLEKGMELKGT